MKLKWIQCVRNYYLGTQRTLLQLIVQICAAAAVRSQFCTRQGCEICT